MPSLTRENYLKAIYQIGARRGDQPATTGQVAEALGVAPGTATSMLKALAELGLVDYRPYEGARLTAAGQSLALRVLRRHRLIELFLVNTLRLSWDEVHAEAENMEHAVSDFLVERIDEALGRPSFDPHGDPIPTAAGELPTASTVPLAQWPVGKPFRLTRVLEQAPEFLRYLSEVGLELGARGELTEQLPAAGVLKLRTRGRELTLAREAAQKMLVEHAPAEASTTNLAASTNAPAPPVETGQS